MKIPQQDIKELIQRGANVLSDLCLANGEIHHAYTDKDFVNASLIFMHFWLDVIHSESKGLTKEARLELAETSGKALRELIRVSTGKDMHKLVKNI